jgi:hypothetical protein
MYLIPRAGEFKGRKNKKFTTTGQMPYQRIIFTFIWWLNLRGRPTNIHTFASSYNKYETTAVRDVIKKN